MLQILLRVPLQPLRYEAVQTRPRVMLDRMKTPGREQLRPTEGLEKQGWSETTNPMILTLRWWSHLKKVEKSGDL